MPFFRMKRVKSRINENFIHNHLNGCPWTRQKGFGRFINFVYTAFHAFIFVLCASFSVWLSFVWKWIDPWRRPDQFHFLKDAFRFCFGRAKRTTGTHEKTTTPCASFVMYYFTGRSVSCELECFLTTFSSFPASARGFGEWHPCRAPFLLVLFLTTHQRYRCIHRFSKQSKRKGNGCSGRI